MDARGWQEGCECGLQRGPPDGHQPGAAVLHPHYHREYGANHLARHLSQCCLEPPYRYLLLSLLTSPIVHGGRHGHSVGGAPTRGHLLSDVRPDGAQGPDTVGPQREAGASVRVQVARTLVHVGIDAHAAKRDAHGEAANAPADDHRRKGSARVATARGGGGADGGVFRRRRRGSHRRAARPLIPRREQGAAPAAMPARDDAPTPTPIAGTAPRRRLRRRTCGRRHREPLAS
mmetsp:Transcript_35041/g.56307  ORF Transcript_35041/g.56307 Transcript_35041/m.56307 type:complete len:232 (-) Transcript_35041:119-814(-)